MTGRARRLLAGALAAGVLAPALLTGCAQSVDPIERLGRKAAEKMPQKTKPPGCGQAFRRASGVSPGRAESRAWGRVGTAPPAGPQKTERHQATQTEPPPPNKRCQEGPGASPAPPEGTPHR
ncbi:hypothetical protein E2651_25490 [Streptomyces sp. MZ04]|nr:hypothetical protein E2651_25490 [Streptomyces sp. MZ04]